MAAVESLRTIARMPRHNCRVSGSSDSARCSAPASSPAITAFRTASVAGVGAGRSGVRSNVCARQLAHHITINAMRRLWLAALFTAVSIPCYSQFLPDLQAKTPAEYDAYLDVLDGPVLKYGAAFERDFPESSLRLPVCELIAREWRAQGDREQAIAAAERGLAIAPDYPPLLVELADLLANGSERLERAAQAANQALGLLDRIKAPLRISPEDWTSAVAKLRARAHSAMGMVLFKKGDNEGAMREFQSA